ncbi:MAG TPA: LuxR C-terminal-related transcriptional regulator [Acidimicrobiales bacterium]|nr:LuxR C-terminal-related transcriptional regulator [Acidimicrobiales bacterium]
MPASAWARAGRSVVDHLAADLAGTGIRVALTDADHGTDRRAPEPWIGVRVPITDPTSGRAIGALDLTSPTAGANPLMLPLATRAAREIEQCLLEDAGLDERLVLHRFLKCRRGAKGPFVLVTNRRIITNAAADRLIAPDDEAVLRDAARRLRAGQAGDVLTLALSGGAVTARAEPVVDDGSPAGIVLRLAPIARAAVGPRPRWGWESLTDTERSVSLLVAEGLTNRQAAERLFLSRHTVDFHLRSIFRKLGVECRVDLTRLVLLSPSDATATSS